MRDPIIMAATVHIFLLLGFIGSITCEQSTLNEWFMKVNDELILQNQAGAALAWEYALDPNNPTLNEKFSEQQNKRIIWQHQACQLLSQLETGHKMNATQKRMRYLLCRGPFYTFTDAKKRVALYEELQSIYSDSKVCIPSYKNLANSSIEEIENTILEYIATVKRYSNIRQDMSENDASIMIAKVTVVKDINKNSTQGYCLKGESDFEKLMRESKNEKVLRWAWQVWRAKVGPRMKEPFKTFVAIENAAARRNGYADIGATWREELEITDLKGYVKKLYDGVRPLYTLLHGVVRFFLRNKYGDKVPKKGPIPAHLLGNLWAQNWEPLTELIVPQAVNLDESIKSMNWSITHLLKTAEDFYRSVGLPPMTHAFWYKSVFSRKNDETSYCHGSAIDMYSNKDFRLLYCSETSFEDLYVVHHEMGHIHYYMAYEHQPGIFRQGANSAFHESIGDAIMNGVTTPQHLYRLGLINDSVLYSTEHYKSTAPDHRGSINSRPRIDERDPNEFTADEILLLKLALNKIPQIPYALLIDEYRWKYFAGEISEGNYNAEFWNMTQHLRGISPPSYRSELYFDIGSKYHVPDNTPFIRYFLSSFLQYQLFEAMCKAAIFGRIGVRADIPQSISINRCDIYGSKAVGKLLKDIMSRGTSQNWRQVLLETIGEDEISPFSLLRYYRPLTDMLARLVREHNIPLGW